MSIGTVVRKILGPRLFALVGRFYRSIFVDLDKVAKILSVEIPPNSHILDIGGGDGEPLNHLLALRRDVTVTMIDLLPDLGSALNQELLDRVTILPETTLMDFTETNRKKVDTIIINDVIHHIPPGDRVTFFREIYELLIVSQANMLIKDVEPGYLVARLGYLSDRYISGDTNVTLIAKTELGDILKKVFAAVEIQETPLFTQNKPNYLLRVTIPDNNS